MSAKWHTFNSGCYTLRVPPGWLVQKRATGTVRVQDPYGAAAITLSVASRPASEPVTPREVEVELTRWVTRQHRVIVTQTPQPLPQANAPAAVTEGLEHIKVGLSWWRRLLGPVPRILWRYWTVMTPRLTVYASTSGQPELLARLRPTFDSIISSLQILTDPADIENTSALQTEDENLSTANSLEWEDLRDSVLPVLVETAKLNRFGSNCVSQEWVNDLHIVYAIRDDATTRGVTQREMENWLLDMDELHERALSNLVTRSRDLTMEGSRAETYTMLAMVTPDPYNSSRILLPDLHAKLREYLGGTFFVSIPSADFLLAFSTEDQSMVQRIRQQMAADYRRVQAPVSPRLFLMTPDGVAGDPDEEEVI